MKAQMLLRSASLIMFVHTIGHTIGALGWSKGPNASIQQVIDNMKNNYFPFMGKSTSLARFYAGYGFAMIGVLLLVSIILWILSNHPAAGLSARLQAIFGIFLVFLGLIEIVYFFPVAAGFSLLAATATIIAASKSAFTPSL